MSQDKVEIPAEGIRVFIPESGWSEIEAAIASEASAPPASTEPLPESVAALAEAMNSLGMEGGRAEVAEPGHSEPAHSEPALAAEPALSEPGHSEPTLAAEPMVLPEQVQQQLQRLGELVESGGGASPAKETAALVEVGEALSNFFYTLSGGAAVTADAAAGLPSWRDVSDLTHQLEEQLRARAELAEQMSALDRDIRSTREDLADLLRVLAELERRNLDTANLRAQLSAMAADVISRRYAGPLLSRNAE